MSYIEGSYKQLLFGVSQQDRKDRLDGQVEAQVNMTSDLTFGLRRRSPSEFVRAEVGGIALENLSCFSTELTGQNVVLMVDTSTGGITLYTADGAALYSTTDAYLEGTPDDLAYTVVQDVLYIANRSIKPTETLDNAGLPNPKRSGYFYVPAGAYEKDFSVSVKVGANEYTLTEKSGNTSVPTEAQPEKIVADLVVKLQADPNVGTAAGYAYYTQGSYVFMTGPVDFSLSSGSGNQYMRTSGAGTINLLSELPASLPPQADGFIVGVGTGRIKTFYRWDNVAKAWVEDAAYEAQATLTNMPIALTNDGSWGLFDPIWERRTAGDTESNPSLKFVSDGITGIGSFQGRLVLLSGDYVCMSGATRPERWYRSTMTALQADDPVEIAASAPLATPYRTAVQFNQDLVLFSGRYQATIPGGQAITPQSATISISSTYTTQANVPPVPVGMSLFFAAPRAAGFAGVWEMTPSPFSERQLTAQDVTGHIPQYITGPIRWMLASSTTNILVVADSKDLTELVIHEYLWTGSEKVHQSWHRWKFAHPVHYAYFVGDILYLIMSANGDTVFCKVDIRQGAGDGGALAGRLDMNIGVTVSAGVVLVPEPLPQIWAGSTIPADVIDNPVWAVRTSGEFAGVREALRTDGTTSVDGGTTYWHYSATADNGDTYRMGMRYTSFVTPSAPIVRDRNEVPITTQRALLHKFVVSLQNTGEFTYRVADKYRALPTVPSSPLMFGSPELNAGAAQVADSTVFIPCRLDMQSALLTLSTDDVYDLNVTSLEYGFKYHQRYGRRA